MAGVVRAAAPSAAKRGGNTVRPGGVGWAPALLHRRDEAGVVWRALWGAMVPPVSCRFGWSGAPVVRLRLPLVTRLSVSTRTCRDCRAPSMAASWVECRASGVPAFRLDGCSGSERSRGVAVVSCRDRLCLSDRARRREPCPQARFRVGLGAMWLWAGGDRRVLHHPAGHEPYPCGCGGNRGPRVCARGNALPRTKGGRGQDVLHPQGSASGLAPTVIDALPHNGRPDHYVRNGAGLPDTKARAAGCKRFRRRLCPACSLAWAQVRTMVSG